MKQEKDEELLLKDLSARLLYGVKVNRLGIVHKLISINSADKTVTIDNNDYMPTTFFVSASEIPIKPYLRSLSSMTEEEKEELKTLFDAEEVTSDSICYIEGGTLVEYLSRISYSFCSEIVDWLNEHHFDHHNLIEKGLALEASSEMYKKGE